MFIALCCAAQRRDPHLSTPIGAHTPFVPRAASCLGPCETSAPPRAPPNRTKRAHGHSQHEQVLSTGKRGNCRRPRASVPTKVVGVHSTGGLYGLGALYCTVLYCTVRGWTRCAGVNHSETQESSGADSPALSMGGCIESPIDEPGR
eukprot:1195089-Prorocentrum_minimum.AAC.1